MHLSYYLALNNAVFKPSNKAIAFHISMTAPKYALNPYYYTHYSLKGCIFENDREKNK